MERLKRKREEEEQQRLHAVFEQYRDEFEESRVLHLNQSFVRGEIVNADKTAPPPRDHADSKTPPVSAKKPVSAEEARRLASEVGRKIMLEAQRKKVATAIQLGTNPVTSANTPTSNSARPPKPGSKKDTQKSKLTNLEMFKRELQQIQEMRNERRGLREKLKQQLGEDADAIDRIAPSLDNPYLFDNGEFSDDLSTTNLYLANLPPDIEMQDLYETFGSFGPLASAKILYPRADEDYRKGKLLSGFIAYMSRIDAERAMTTMAGADIKGSDIRVSWARPVVLPPVPFYVPQTLRDLAMPDTPSGLPFNAKPQPSDLRSFLQKYRDLPRIGAPLPLDAPEMINDFKEMLSRSIVRVVTPTERPLLILIHRVIEFVIRAGPMFEACIMERERMNPMFRFLFDNNHPTHVYYRWKLYSLLNGEDPHEWRQERFRMFEGGSWWEPPPHNLYDGGMPTQLYHRAYRPAKVKRLRMVTQAMGRSSSPDRKRSRLAADDEDTPTTKRRGVLLSVDRDFFEDMLRDLTPEKIAIGDALIWCLEHADCAKEIVQTIFESLCIKETPLHKKIARFYLINDILRNCGVPISGVFYYRQYFQDYLERIFVVLNATLESIESRIKAEQFRQRVMLCFRAWEDNSIYPRDILINLQNIFLGLVKPGNATEHDTDDEEDLDGVPLKAPTDDDDEGDIDGIPLDFPTSSTSKPASTSKPVNRNSSSDSHKWKQDTLDSFSSKWDAPDLNESLQQSATKESAPTDTPSSSKKDERASRKNGRDEKSKAISIAHEEERRRLLREVELEMVKYQDDLESENAPNIDKKLADYRRKLMEKLEKDLDAFDDGQISEELSRKKESKKSKNDDRSERKRSREPKRRSRDRKRSRSRERRSRSRDRRSRSRERDRHRRDRSSPERSSSDRRRR